MQFWLLKTAANEVHGHYRKETRHRDRARRAMVEATVHGHAVDELEVIERLDHDDRRIALREAFGQLGDRCRELLHLLMVEPPLSYAEIAELLGRSTGYIGPTRQRCLGELRVILGQVSSR